MIKVEFVKKMHETIKEQIEQQTEKYMKHNNKGKRKIFFRRETGFGFISEKIDFLIKGLCY